VVDATPIGVIFVTAAGHQGDRTASPAGLTVAPPASALRCPYQPAPPRSRRRNRGQDRPNRTPTCRRPPLRPMPARISRPLRSNSTTHISHYECGQVTGSAHPHARPRSPPGPAFANEFQLACELHEQDRVLADGRPDDKADLGKILLSPPVIHTPMHRRGTVPSGRSGDRPGRVRFIRAATPERAGSPPEDRRRSSCRRVISAGSYRSIRTEALGDVRRDPVTARCACLMENPAARPLIRPTGTRSSASARAGRPQLTLVQAESGHHLAVVERTLQNCRYRLAGRRNGASAGPAPCRFGRTC